MTAQISVNPQRLSNFVSVLARQNSNVPVQDIVTHLDLPQQEQLQKVLVHKDVFRILVGFLATLPANHIREGLIYCTDAILKTPSKGHILLAEIILVVAPQLWQDIADRIATSETDVRKVDRIVWIYSLAPPSIHCLPILLFLRPTISSIQYMNLVAENALKIPQKVVMKVPVINMDWIIKISVLSSNSPCEDMKSNNKKMVVQENQPVRATIIDENAQITKKLSKTASTVRPNEKNNLETVDIGREADHLQSNITKLLIADLIKFNDCQVAITHLSKSIQLIIRSPAGPRLIKGWKLDLMAELVSKDESLYIASAAYKEKYIDVLEIFITRLGNKEFTSKIKDLELIHSCILVVKNNSSVINGDCIRSAISTIKFVNEGWAPRRLNQFGFIDFLLFLAMAFCLYSLTVVCDENHGKCFNLNTGRIGTASINILNKVGVYAARAKDDLLFVAATANKVYSIIFEDFARHGSEHWRNLLIYNGENKSWAYFVAGLKSFADIGDSGYTYVVHHRFTNDIANASVRNFHLAAALITKSLLLIAKLWHTASLKFVEIYIPRFVGFSNTFVTKQIPILQTQLISFADTCAGLAESLFESYKSGNVAETFFRTGNYLANFAFQHFRHAAVSFQRLCGQTSPTVKIEGLNLFDFAADYIIWVYKLFFIGVRSLFVEIMDSFGNDLVATFAEYVMETQKYISEFIAGTTYQSLTEYYFGAIEYLGIQKYLEKFAVTLINLYSTFDFGLIYMYIHDFSAELGWIELAKNIGVSIQSAGDQYLEYSILFGEFVINQAKDLSTWSQRLNLSQISDSAAGFVMNVFNSLKVSEVADSAAGFVMNLFKSLNISHVADIAVGFGMNLFKSLNISELADTAVGFGMNVFKSLNISHVADTVLGFGTGDFRNLNVSQLAGFVEHARRALNV